MWNSSQVQRISNFRDYEDKWELDQKIEAEVKHASS